MTRATPTPKPATAAQRQSRRRQRLRANGEHQRLNLWIGLSAYLALQRLARRDALTQAQLLERLILQAEDVVVARLQLDAPEWDDYFLARSQRRPPSAIEDADMT